MMFDVGAWTLAFAIAYFAHPADDVPVAGLAEATIEAAILTEGGNSGPSSLPAESLRELLRGHDGRNRLDSLP
jgi:hypothetical protein